MADLMTNAQLAQLINDALAKWNAREAEQYAWVSGSATGGPNGDGRFPLSNGSGSSNLIDSPAKLADLLNGPAALAGAARDEAQVFRDAAQSAATAASTDKTLANNSKLAAQDARDLAMLYRDQTAALQATVSVSEAAVAAALASVTTKEANVITLHGETLVARDDAVVAKTAAEAAAALAATFNPNDFYTKVASDGRYVQLTNFNWSSLSNKPGVFPPEAHTHIISEITGLQAALDGKQAAGSYAPAVHTHDYLPLSGGTLTGGLSVAGDITASRSASEGVLYLSSSGSKYLRFGDGVYGLPGADLYINSHKAWHEGNFNPTNKSDVGHTHIIGNVAGLQDALNDKVTRSNTGVRFGVLPYKAALWVNDGSDGTGIGGWARSFAIQAGSNSTHGGFFTAYGGDTQAAEVRIGVGTVDTSYTQSNALCITTSGMTWANNTVWHGGNFDPNSKLSTSGGTMTGTLSMSSSPIVMAFSGSLPYLDMQTTGVAGGRNYRIRSGIEGVANAGFSIKDLTSDTNVLSIDGSGALYTGNAKFVHKSNFGYSTSYKTVVLGGEYLTTVSLGYDPSANASGSFNGNGEGREVLFRNGVSFLTPNAANNSYHLTLNMADGKVGVGTTSPITSLDTVGDITARGGNIYVRENPSGAGAGMRLHHSGGGAYIDFDGNLNFRNGEGGGIASLNSDGAFIASNVIGTEQLRVGGYTSATGFMNFSNGNAGNPGYAAWFSADGVRRGYMGWSEGSNIVYQAENGWGLKFNSDVTFATTNPLYASKGLQTLGQIRACGWYASPSGGSYTGLGVEIGVSGSNGYIYAYDRNASAYGPLRLGGSNIYAENPFTFNSSATFLGQTDFGSNLRASGSMALWSYGGSTAMGAYLSLRDNGGVERGWIGYGENTSQMRVRNAIGTVMVHGTTVNLYSDNSGGQTRIQNANGFVDIGPVNTAWCHFYTDRPAFYFQNAVHFDGAPQRYSQGALLHHDSGSMTSGKITTSTSAPSGGSDGDVWFKVAS